MQGSYLKSIPPDPFGKGEAIHYRLVGKSTDRAIVWSVGRDGVSQAGQLPAEKPSAGEAESESRTRTVFEIKAVRKSPGGK